MRHTKRNLTAGHYEIETDERLPDGWDIAVWPDGTAMVCSPGTCPAELGWIHAYPSVVLAVASVLPQIEAMQDICGPDGDDISGQYVPADGVSHDD